MHKTSQTKPYILGVALSVSSLVALVSWVLSSPVAASPDEGFQLATIWCSSGIEQGHCEQDASGNRMVPAGVYNWCYQHLQNESAACLSSQISNDMVTAERIGTVSIWTKFLELFSGEPVSPHVVLLRVIGIFLVLLSVGITFLLSDNRNRFSLAIALGVLFVPHGIFLVSMAHPSGIVSAFSLAAIILHNQLLKQSFHPAKRKYALILLLLLVFLILNIRREAFIFLLMAGMFLSAINLFNKSNKSRRFKLTVVLGALLTLTGSVLGLKTFVPSALPLTLKVWGDTFGVGRASWNVLTTNLQNFPSLIMGNFGFWGLGALDVPIPIIVWSSIGLTVAGIATLALYFSRGENLFYAIGMIFMTVFLILTILQTSRLYVGEEMQPRYLLPLLTVTFAVVVANSRMKRPEQLNSRLLAFATIFVASMANSISLWTVMRRYISGLDVGELSLNHQQEWWWNIPTGPNFVWLVGTISFGAALSIGIYLALGSREPIQSARTHIESVNA